MNFVDAIKICFQKYVGFRGRAPRSEFWWFFLFLIIVSAVLGAISSLANNLFFLATLLPFAAVSFRRLHDVGRSAWWLLAPTAALIVMGAGMYYGISILSYAGGIASLVLNILLLVWYCKKGEAGENRFGPPPLPAAEATPQAA